MTEQEFQKLKEQIFNFLLGTSYNLYSPDDCDRLAIGFTTFIKAFMRQANYVRLSPDQSLPDIGCGGCVLAISQAQQDMLKAGWRKVEIENGNNSC